MRWGVALPGIRFQIVGRESLCAVKDRNLYLSENLDLVYFRLYYSRIKEFFCRESVSVYALIDPEGFS